MKFISGFVCALALIAFGAAVYVYSGRADVAASSADGAFERWVLHTAMTRSVITGASIINDPPSFTDEMIKDGFAHYDDMCTTCHAGPGIERSEIAQGLNPQAPDLADAVKARTPQQLFWIVKNGVKMTAMPSFGVTHDDKEVWSIVAFIEKLPEMSAEQYRQIKREVGPNAHEEMMDMKNMDMKH